MWYDKKKAEKLATKPKKDALNEQARMAIRARLAIMQFRRQRMSKAATADEEDRRRNLGIWSFQGGKKMGPVVPKVSVVNEDEKGKKKKTKVNENNNEKVVSENAGEILKNKKENVTEKKVSISGDVADKGNDNERNIRKGRSVLPKADHNMRSSSCDSSTRENNVPPIPLERETFDGNSSKPSSERSEKSSVITASEFSRSPSVATESEASSPCRESKRPGSSRKLFTVVTPAFHQQDSARGSPSFKRKSLPASDARSIKSLSTQNSKTNVEESDLPPRPTTSFQEKGKPAGKLVGAALHSSPVKTNNETSGKLGAGSPVKVKPKSFGIGVVKGDNSRMGNVAKAGSKSRND